MTELANLVGLHKLTGVDRNVILASDGNGYDDAGVINFTLDGVTYSAIEDPQDGYRSCMKELIVTGMQTTNTFAAVQLMCRMRDDDPNGNKHDVLDCYDVVTGKTVLSIGTKDTGDYYPVFVNDFWPENMSINQ